LPGPKLPKTSGGRSSKKSESARLHTQWPNTQCLAANMDKVYIKLLPTEEVLPMQYTTVADKTIDFFFFELISPRVWEGYQ